MGARRQDPTLMGVVWCFWAEKPLLGGKERCMGNPNPKWLDPKLALNQMGSLVLFLSPSGLISGL
jgi:hypothetical protein